MLGAGAPVISVLAGVPPAHAIVGGSLRELGPDGVMGWAAAFQAQTEGTLWTVTPDNVGHDTGSQMATGSSPAVAGLTSGAFEVVFAGQGQHPAQAGTGRHSRVRDSRGDCGAGYQSRHRCPVDWRL